MKKRNRFLTGGERSLFRRIVKIMKLTTFILLATTMMVSASLYSQNTKLSLKFTEISYQEMFKEIENQTEFRFAFSSSKLDPSQKVAVDLKKKTLGDVLDETLPEEIGYEIIDRYVVIMDVSDKKSVVEIQQQKAVTGKVTDNAGQPIPGVTVVIKGTMQGTVTNVAGEYTLPNTRDNAVLQFSFVGMLAQEVEVGNQSTINITMKVDAIGIEEVVAIGYGSLQRNRISTSVTSVEPEMLTRQTMNTLDGALEGQVAGLTIQQTTGEPGGGAVMNLRGSSSIGASTEPLVVIDGVPIQSSYDKRISPLSTINPAIIESVEVLKDVSATSIYGSRGSNGVILITTKSGKIGETQVSFSAEFGVNNTLGIEKIDLCNAEEFARWRKETAYERAAYYGEEISLEDIPEEYRYPEQLGEGTDWQDVMSQVGIKHNYNLNISHGTETFRGFYSIGYLSEEGTVIGTKFERLTMQANMDYTPNDFISLGLNIRPSVRVTGFEASGGTSEGGSRGTALGQAVLATPVDGPYDDNDPWEQDEYFDDKWDIAIHSAGTFHADNPLYRVKTEIDQTRNLDLQMQPTLQLNLLKELSFTSHFNIDFNHYSRERFKPSTISNIKKPPPATITGSYNTNRNISWQSENLLNYEKSFNNHRINGLAGYTREHYNGYSSSMNGTGFPGDKIKTLNQATDLSGNTGESNWSLISYLLRLNYDYNSKYLLTGTLRRDGSSRFGSNRRWGYFPSGSFGWNITKENFFPDPEWLTNLKFRTSYGLSGNNKIGNYTWIPGMSVTNYTFGGKVVSGQSVAGMENVNLSWEKSSELNTGMDLTLFKGKLNFIFDYYSRITQNMLWGVNLPVSSGYNSLTDNVGKVRNRGLEFTISSTNISKPDFNWKTNFNISFNRNKVLSLGQVDKILGGVKQGTSITRVGLPMGMFQTFTKLGIIQDQAQLEQVALLAGQTLPGTPYYEDVDGNGIIDLNDYQILGNPWPKFRGGLTNNLSYKNWDFSIFMSFAYDYDVWAMQREDFRNYDGVFNVAKDVEERWRSPEEPGNGMIPQTFGQQSLDRKYGHSGYLHNVSFLKIQNINIGHTFDNINFARLRLYCSVQNPFIFTNYEYGNPDIGLYGGDALEPNYDKYDHPLYSTILLGLNMQF